MIEAQATEEFNNKESHAVELARFKHRLNIVIDCMDSITNDPNVSPADRIKSEKIKVDAIGKLRDVIEASISSPDPYSALKKIVELSNNRR